MKTKPGKRSDPHTSKQIISRAQVRSVTTLASDGAKLPKQAHERLKPWLGLANMVPAPARDGTERPARLLIARVDGAQFLRQFESSPLARVPAISSTIDLQHLRESPEEGHRLLELAQEISITLQTLAQAASVKVLKAAGEEPILIRRIYKTPATSRSEVWMRRGSVAAKWIDPFQAFLDALEGVEGMRVRGCPICSQFFYAVRKDQKACSKRCNASRRVRDWRANRAQHEYRRKLRSAGLLPKTRSPK